ncbi:MAG: MFS transporter [Ignavibacteriae bacterium]|nr:MFS transporter [Ignavibacteriota bacterium]MCB9208442.1 MFS transporter [Ignavibacteriales bacterium]MCB9258450.1 MFS transporter [Ignavibacteriales bacterium]
MKEQKKFQTGNVILISLTHFVHDVYSSFLAPILPLLIEKLSISYSLAGLLTVVQRLPSLLNPLIGLIADKASVKYFVIFSPAVTVIVMSLLGAAPNYFYVVLILFVMGISASTFHVPAPVVIKQIAGNRIGKGMSFFMLGGELARSVGPLVILGGISAWGLEGTYKLIPFGLAASLLLFFRFRKLEFTDLEGSQKRSGVYNAFRKYLSLFLMIMGILFFTSLIKSAITTFLAVYLTNQGESLWYAGGALSIFQFAGAGGTFLAGTISDKIGRRKTLSFAAAVNPALMLLFVYSTGITSFIILLLLGFFLFAFTPVLLAMVNEWKSDFPTFLNGIFMTINFLTGAITVSIIGFAADFLSLETTYLFCALFGIVTIPFVLKLKT